ncbi:hypothetical protein [Rhizobium sp. A37_96]
MTPGGPALLVLGVVAGLAWPQLANAARPLMPTAIFILVLGTLLRVDRREFMIAFRRPHVSVFLPLVAMLACPFVAAIATLIFGPGPELSAAIILSVSAPPSSGTAAVARMLGLDATLPFAVTLWSMAIAPLTLPLIAVSCAGIALDPVELASRLALMIGGAGAVALLLRRYADAPLARNGGLIDRFVLVALLVFAVATMANVTEQITVQPLTSATYVGLAFAINLALQCLGAILQPGTLPERLKTGLVLGNRNVGLVWATIGATVSPVIALFFAATQLPIYMIPRLIEVILRRADKEKVL